MATELSYMKAGYKNDKWKWVLSLNNKENLSTPNEILQKISRTNLLQTYGLDKPPKLLPCRKKCNSNAWCLASISKESKSNAARLTEQIRDMNHPIGLQNTANTCWVNSALQALFHLHLFRNCINSIEGFQGEENLSSLDYLLQSMFVEMELHENKALACSTGSVFEKLAIFVTKEVMQKDQDYEVLKCVSEFLENTIDNLLGNPRTGPQFSPIFRTTLYRVAKWKCSSCKKEHIRQLPPDTCYTMAAYVSADECPLDQCILDLQTETQTGVSLVCVGAGGCGATVKVDRVVTPQILNLPSLLIIRNNSLVDKEIKRRLHVVYPEILDLTAHTCNHEAAPYSLRAVIYHHGHWIKHFSAHVKMEDGKWYNFNDEKVSRLVNRSGNCPPLETHKDYFSIATVANKYRSRSRVRVSRGAFIWIYEKDSVDKEKTLLQPPSAVLDYVLSRQKSKEKADLHLIEERKKERNLLFEELAIQDIKHENMSLISKPLLTTWLTSQDLKFVPQPSLLAEGMCEHRKFDPMKLDSFKCIRKEEAEKLKNCESGIHLSDAISIILSFEDALCLQCVARHAHHILFREHLKDLYKKAKKMSSKEPQNDTTLIGTITLSSWMKLALSAYVKETGLEEPEEGSSLEDDQEGETKPPTDEKCIASREQKAEEASSTETQERNLSKEKMEVAVLSNGDSGKKEESSSFAATPKENGTKANAEMESFTYFNEDIVCPHNMICPKATGVWLSKVVADEMIQLCAGMAHPATFQEDFSECSDCKRDLDKTLETCSNGKLERKKLYHLFMEKKRPHRLRDAGKPLFLLSRNFFSEWKSFIRLSVREDQEICKPNNINNSELLCHHNKLLYPYTEDGALHEFAVIITEEEWGILKENYPFDHSIAVHYGEDGQLLSELGVCEEGCVEIEAIRMYEEQFTFEYELIYVRQVHSVDDVPSGTIGPLPDAEEPSPKKKPRLARESASVSSSLRTASQRLVRASKSFSSSDTIKEIQNFIADRTGIWPLLQTLWLSGGKEHGPRPYPLTDKHRSMTLNALRIKPGDTIYFRAAIEDLEKAAGDGETEYNEIIMDES